MPKYIIQRGVFRDGKRELIAGDEITLSSDEGTRHVSNGDLMSKPTPAKPAKKASKNTAEDAQAKAEADAKVKADAEAQATAASPSPSPHSIPTSSPSSRR